MTEKHDYPSVEGKIVVDLYALNSVFENEIFEAALGLVDQAEWAIAGRSIINPNPIKANTHIIGVESVDLLINPDGDLEIIWVAEYEREAI